MSQKERRILSRRGTVIRGLSLLESPQVLLPLIPKPWDAVVNKIRGHLAR